MADRDQQTEHNHTLLNGGWLVALTICCRTVGVASGKMAVEKLLYFSVFRRLWHLMANIFWMKRDTDNRARTMESTKALLHCPKIPWTLVHKRLKRDWTFYPPYFVPTQSIAHPLSGIDMAPHSDSKWNSIGFVCSSDSKPHKMLSCNCYCVGRP